jgi:hypothetical protein
LKLRLRRQCPGVRFAFWAFALATISLSANPGRDAKRTVNGFSIDLNPVFKWWQKRDGDRPLPAWRHLAGVVVGTNSGAWLIERWPDESAADRKSRAAESPPAASGAGKDRVFLIHPPIDDAADFQRLLIRLAQLNHTRSALVSEKVQAHDRDKAVTRLERASHRNRAQARVLAAEDKQLKSVETQADLQQKAVDEELREIKAKLAGYPKPDEYVLDCFALELHSESQGIPVYDYGNPSK